MSKGVQKKLKEIFCSQVFMGPASGGHGGASEWRLWTDVPRLAREEASGHKERVTLRPGAKTSETFKEVVMAQLTKWENAQKEVMHWITHCSGEVRVWDLMPETWCHTKGQWRSYTENE